MIIANIFSVGVALLTCEVQCSENDAFKALYLRTFIKGGAHMHCIEVSHIDATM